MLCNKTINRLSSHVRNLRPAMMSSLAPKVQQFITENADIMKVDIINLKITLFSKKNLNLNIFT